MKHNNKVLNGTEFSEIYVRNYDSSVISKHYGFWEGIYTNIYILHNKNLITASK